MIVDRQGRRFAIVAGPILIASAWTCDIIPEDARNQMQGVGCTPGQLGQRLGRLVVAQSPTACIRERWSFHCPVYRSWSFYSSSSWPQTLPVGCKPGDEP